MKIFEVSYNEYHPSYSINVEAQNKEEAEDKAKEILDESLDNDYFVIGVEEVKGVEKGKRVNHLDQEPCPVSVKGDKTNAQNR